LPTYYLREIEYQMNVYAFKNTTVELAKSSSGGAFNGLIRAFCAYFEKPVIVGAAFDVKGDVRHEYAFSLIETEKFNGSKYVKSDLRKVYDDIATRLDNGENILFSGTPCQVHGLNSYLKKRDINTDKLITIDIICHGTPPKRFFIDYKKWLENKEKKRIIEIRFRDKRGAWKDYCMSVKFDDGSELFDTYNVRTYMRLFFSKNIIDRRCFSCHFANLERTSDVTIGDFWGIEEIMPKVDSSNGVSLIISNSKKGEALIDMMRTVYDSANLPYILKPYLGKEFLKYQWNLSHPSTKPDTYDEFNNYYKKNGFEKTMQHFHFNSTYGHVRNIVGNVLRRIGWRK